MNTNTVNTFEREDPALPIPIRMGKTFALIGSSITLASIAESLAFVLGLGTFVFFVAYWTVPQVP